MDLANPSKRQKTTVTLGKPCAGDSGQQVTADMPVDNSTTPRCDPTAGASKVLLIITHNMTHLYFNCKIVSSPHSFQLCCLIFNFNEMPPFRNLQIFLTNSYNLRIFFTVSFFYSCTSITFTQQKPSLLL